MVQNLSRTLTLTTRFFDQLTHLDIALPRLPAALQMHVFAVIIVTWRMRLVDIYLKLVRDCSTNQRACRVGRHTLLWHCCVQLGSHDSAQLARDFGTHALRIFTGSVMCAAKYSFGATLLLHEVPKKSCPL